MSRDQCCVPGCRESGRTQSVLHGFPHPDKDTERFRMWIYAVGGDILGLSNDYIYKNRRICRSHFEDKYCCRFNRLSNIAIPTANMPGLRTIPKFNVVPRRPLQGIENLLSPIPTTSTDVEGVIFNIFDETPKSIYEHDRQTENICPTAVSRKTVRRICHLSQEEKVVQSQLVAARRKIRKLHNQVKKQSAEIKAAKKLTSNPAVLRVLENCTSSAKLLMEIQWRENRKKQKGRRFTTKEKFLSLCILKQSPKAYNFLRKIFILPAAQTLAKIIQKINLKPGINKNIFSQLTKKVMKMEQKEKLCILLFDEMSLKAHVYYNEKKEKIIGFLDDGHTRQPEFADHAQVFMVRGLIKNFKQVVAYTFAASATKGPALAKQIKDVITEIQNSGLIVVATVCDQGTNNCNAIKILLNETRGTYLRRGETPKENIILINGQEIIPLYDPPHLLKGIRNNLMSKNLKFMKDGKIKIAKWSQIEQLSNENPGYKGIRMIPKLTEIHVNPQKINKMKVKYASQIFSRTVASSMGYLADKAILPADCKDTADLLLFMDNIFDSVNGSYKKNKNAKPLLGPATDSSIHKKIWAEAKDVFKSMKFITPSGREESVPTTSNWVWTLNGIHVLLHKLKKDFSVSSVWLRHLNQDPLENFFGGIRSHGCRNNNPTCDQFESSVTTLLVNNLTCVHSRGKNCEDDFCKALYSLVFSENPEVPSTSTFNFASALNINFTPIDEKNTDPKKIAPLQYVSGYFLKKAKSNIFKNCTECSNNLSSADEIEYIKYREYAGRRWLCAPSNGLIILISQMQDIINFILRENLEIENLKEVIKTSILMLVDFDVLNCQEHKEQLTTYLVNIVSRCLIFNYCKDE